MSAVAIVTRTIKVDQGIMGGKMGQMIMGTMDMMETAFMVVTAVVAVVVAVVAVVVAIKNNFHEISIATFGGSVRSNLELINGNEVI